MRAFAEVDISCQVGVILDSWCSEPSSCVARFEGSDGFPDEAFLGGICLLQLVATLKAGWEELGCLFGRYMYIYRLRNKGIVFSHVT